MTEQELALFRMQAVNQPRLDYAGEVFYAFGCLPENARRNAEIYRRAVARAAEDSIEGLSWMRQQALVGRQDNALDGFQRIK